MSNSATTVAHEGIDPQAGAVPAWRVSRLIGLGLAQPVAEVTAAGSNG